jgi:hypothetical protein
VREVHRGIVRVRPVHVEVGVRIPGYLATAQGQAEKRRELVRPPSLRWGSIAGTDLWRTYVLLTEEASEGGDKRLLRDAEGIKLRDSSSESSVLDLLHGPTLACAHQITRLPTKDPKAP